MKLNKIKKPKKQFDPIHHWHLILTGIFGLFALIIAYSVYSFFYIKSEIAQIDLEARATAQNSTSSDVLEKSRNNSKFLKDINNLNATLEEYNQKEMEYNRLIKSGVPAPVLSTTTASGTVATSTN